MIEEVFVTIFGMRFVKTLSFSLLFTLLFGFDAALAVRAQHLDVDLVMSHQTLVPGERAHVGLHFKLDPHWHVYWINPGDSGDPPQVEWQLPAGVKVGEIEWPLPQKIPVGPLMNYGYENEVLLPMPFEISPEFQGQSLKLVAEARWLVCKEECVPGKARLEKIVQVRPSGSPEPDPKWQAHFLAARDSVPKLRPDDWRLSGKTKGESLVLTIQAPSLRGVSKVDFLPSVPDHIEHAKEPLVKIDGDRIEIELSKSDRLLNDPEALPGVLIASFESGRVEAYETSIPFQVAGTGGGLAILIALASAFLGGVILNLMPCVFPVLSMKVMSIMSMSGMERAKVIKHGWAYAFGILVSFWILAAALLILRLTGSQIGWGFQLQSPQFVFALACLLFFFGLNLLGFFEISGSFTGIGSSLSSQEGYRGSFFTGVLATLVATPCTAPFMGSAVGFALTQAPVVAVLIFTSLALGLASPYIVLSYVPSLGSYLPRPGRWMESFKQFMAFLIFATVLWLMWILGQQTLAAGPVYLFAAFLVISFAVWLSVRWPKLAKVSAIGGVVFLFLIGLSLKTVEVENVAVSGVSSSGKLQWEKFSPEKLAQYREDGKAVFLNFTAAWCITCKVNEMVALNDPDVRAKFNDLDIVLMKADWTNHDPIITETLSKFGRSGVPFYVLYPKDKSKPAVEFPEVITAGLVLKHLSQMEESQ